MNANERQIITAILQQGTVHYSDIEKLTGRSKKTVARYLDNIAAVATQYGAALVRKRNVGIYFDGETKRLSAAVNDGGVNDNQGTKQQRLLSLISKLLLAKSAQTIQELADSSYVSRSTFEDDLRSARQFIEEHGATLESGQNGIWVSASERVRRELMAELLNLYWGQPAYIGNRRQNTHDVIKVPTEISEFFNGQTLDQVMLALDQLENVTAISLSDYEYQSLAVHLVIAIERIRRHQTLKGIPDHVTLEPATEVLVGIIEHHFGITIPADEKQYLNIHILAAEQGTSGKSQFSSQQLCTGESGIADFLREHLTQFDDTLIQNLTLHLVPALKRISLGLKLRNPYTGDTKRYFPLAYNRAVDLGMKLTEKFDVDLNDDEIAFIALHIEAFIERSEKKTTAVLVCSTGLGTARLLEQRMRKYFSSQIEIKRVVSVQELLRADIPEDIVISTINIAVDDKPIVVVPPFLDDGALKRIDEVAQKVDRHKPNNTAFLHLLRKRLITFANEPMDKEAAIRILGDQIQRTGYGRVGISDAAVAREQLASTAITSVAVPHAPIEFVKTPCIAILINPAGIKWDTHKVKIVFFLTMNMAVKKQINQIYMYFNEVLDDQRLLAHMEKATQPEEVIQILGGDLNE